MIIVRIYEIPFLHTFSKLVPTNPTSPIKNIMNYTHCRAKSVAHVLSIYMVYGLQKGDKHTLINHGACASRTCTKTENKKAVLWYRLCYDRLRLSTVKILMFFYRTGRGSPTLLVRDCNR